MYIECKHNSNGRCDLLDYVCPNTRLKCKDYPNCIAKQAEKLNIRLDGMIKEAIENVKQ
jgi:hypothetical protein